MKRLLLALIILGAGGSLVGTFHHSAATWETSLAARRAEWLTLTQSITHAQSESADLNRRIAEQKALRSGPQAGSRESIELAAMIETNGLARLSPEQRERLLAELGFNWNTPGNYLIVSKQSLQDISFNSFTGRLKTTGTARSVLGFTPDEAKAVEAAMRQTRADYGTWLAAHVQRAEPTGDIVASYQIPADPEFTQKGHDQLYDALETAIGEERADWLLKFAERWVEDLGVGEPEPTTLTITRDPNDTEIRYQVTLKTGPTTSVIGMVPDDEQFPERLRPLFPEGWWDVAKREGFQLPKEFKQKPALPAYLRDFREFM